jgi:uncharacterized protein YndB with AHSA1/START domain/DNA-binding transcriptional ArsR family regulator
MVERNDPPLSAILKAASDTTRRAILTLLAQQGATRVTDLAAHFDMSLNSVSKHIKVLEKSGLVQRRTIGRVHLIEVDMAPLGRIDDWFAQLRSIWALRLETLDTLLTKDADMTDLTLTVTRTINAPPQRVFDAWLDPEMLARFMRPGPDMTVPKVQTDAVEGGRFLVVMRAGDIDMPHSGTYLKIERHSHLAFSWESAMSTDDSTVSLDFKDLGGATELTLTHVTFVDQQARDNHAAGWGAILGALAAALD